MLLYQIIHGKISESKFKISALKWNEEFELLDIILKF